MTDHDRRNLRWRRLAIRIGIYATVLLVLLLQTALVTALAFPELHLLAWLGM